MLINIIGRRWKKRGIVALSRPEINQEGLKENTDFSFSASFETEPEFEPKGYKGMELEKEIFQVTEDDMEKRIQRNKANVCHNGGSYR